MCLIWACCTSYICCSSPFSVPTPSTSSLASTASRWAKALWLHVLLSLTILSKSHSTPLPPLPLITPFLSFSCSPSLPQQQPCGVTIGSLHECSWVTHSPISLECALLWLQSYHISAKHFYFSSSPKSSILYIVCHSCFTLYLALATEYPNTTTKQANLTPPPTLPSSTLFSTLWAPWQSESYASRWSSYKTYPVILYYVHLIYIVLGVLCACWTAVCLLVRNRWAKKGNTRINIADPMLDLVRSLGSTLVWSFLDLFSPCDGVVIHLAHADVPIPYGRCPSLVAWSVQPLRDYFLSSFGLNLSLLFMDIAAGNIIHKFFIWFLLIYVAYWDLWFVITWHCISFKINCISL